MPCKFFFAYIFSRKNKTKQLDMLDGNRLVCQEKNSALLFRARAREKSNGLFLWRNGLIIFCALVVFLLRSLFSVIFFYNRYAWWHFYYFFPLKIFCQSICFFCCNGTVDPLIIGLCMGFLIIFPGILSRWLFFCYLSFVIFCSGILRNNL